MWPLDNIIFPVTWTGCFLPPLNPWARFNEHLEFDRTQFSKNCTHCYIRLSIITEIFKRFRQIFGPTNFRGYDTLESACETTLELFILTSADRNQISDTTAVKKKWTAAIVLATSLAMVCKVHQWYICLNLYWLYSRVQIINVQGLVYATLGLTLTYLGTNTNSSIGALSNMFSVRAIGLGLGAVAFSYVKTNVKGAKPVASSGIFSGAFWCVNMTDMQMFFNSCCAVRVGNSYTLSAFSSFTQSVGGGSVRWRLCTRLCRNR